jgi:hypothetical protein
MKISTSKDSQSSDLLTSEEWISVLKLSTMWLFQDIRAKAIKALGSLTLSMDLIDKIVIARKFAVSAWLVPSLHALVQREKPLDLSEGNRLGLEWALKVAEVREYGATTAVALPTCQSCSYTGTAICGSCHSPLSPANGSGKERSTSTKKKSKEAGGGRASIDYSDKIREIFELE